jgi:hypothetical protein
VAATAQAAAAIDFTTGLAGDGVYHDFISITTYVRTVPNAVMSIDMSNSGAIEPATMMVLGTGLLAACRARGRRQV